VSDVPVSRDHVLGLLAGMLRIRQFEDRAAELYGAGAIRGFMHLYNGEEAIAVGIMRALDPRDAIISTYREHGHAIARGVPMNTLMAELFGKVTGCSRGRGGSMHFFDAATRFYGGNAIVGGGLPLAVGLALALRLQKRDGIAVCFFGEGAVAEGAFHESLNLAALWRLPVLFVCENNRYAMGTALQISESETDIHAKAASYLIESQAVDGMDVLAIEAAARAAVDRIRRGGGPGFLECRSYRLRAHSMFDTELYRDRAEVEEWRGRGPLITFTNRMKAQGLVTEEDFLRLRDAADAEVEAAVRFATDSAWEDVRDLTRFVCAEGAAP